MWVMVRFLPPGNVLPSNWVFYELRHKIVLLLNSQSPLLTFHVPFFVMNEAHDILPEFSSKHKTWKEKLFFIEYLFNMDFVYMVLPFKLHRNPMIAILFKFWAWSRCSPLNLRNLYKAMHLLRGQTGIWWVLSDVTVCALSIPLPLLCKSISVFQKNPFF